MQYARPIADISVGSWGTTPLWDKLDEVAPDDATTQVLSSNRPSNDTFEVRLSSVTDPLQSVGHVVRIRMYGTSGHTWSAYLYQGTTLIKTLVSGAAVPSGYTTYSYTLTAGEADSITNYSDLRVRIVANGSASGRDYVTWVEMEVPDVLIQKSGSAVISGRGNVLVAVAKLALAAAAFGVLGHTLATGIETFNAFLHGGGTVACGVRKGAFDSVTKSVSDLFAYADSASLPSPWVQMYNTGGAYFTTLGVSVGYASFYPNNGFKDGWAYHSDAGPTKRGTTRYRADSLSWTTYNDLIIRAQKTGANTGKAIHIRLTASGYTYLSAFEHVNNSTWMLLNAVNIGGWNNLTVEVEQVSDGQIDIYCYPGGIRTFVASIYPTQVTEPGYSGIHLYRTNSYSAYADDFQYFERFGQPTIVSGGWNASQAASVTSDAFQRVENPIQPPWYEIKASGGDYPIVATPMLMYFGQYFYSSTEDGRAASYHSGGPYTFDQYVEMYEENPSSYPPFLILRYDPATKTGLFLEWGRNNLYLFEWVNGTRYNVQSYYYAPGFWNLHWMRFEARHDRFRVLSNGALVWEGTLGLQYANKPGYSGIGVGRGAGGYRLLHNYYSARIPSGAKGAKGVSKGVSISESGNIYIWSEDHYGSLAVFGKGTLATAGKKGSTNILYLPGSGATSATVSKGGQSNTVISSSFSDDFNRPGPGIGNGWVFHGYYPYQIRSGRITGPGGYNQALLWESIGSAIDSAIQFTHYGGGYQWPQPWSVALRAGCKGWSQWNEPKGGYVLTWNNPAANRWTLKYFSDSGYAETLAWQPGSEPFPADGDIFKAELRGDRILLYRNGNLIWDYTDPVSGRFAGLNGYTGFYGVSVIAWTTEADNAAIWLYGSEIGINIHGGGAVSVSGTKQKFTTVAIHGGGSVFVSAREDARYPAAVSGRGSVVLTGREGAKRAVPLSGTGLVSLAGYAGMRGDSYIPGGGQVDVTGDGSFVDTASVTALIHGGGSLYAAGSRSSGVDAYVFGGGRLEVVYDRAWPYLEVGRIENPDAVCHLVKIEMDYCTRTFGTSPCLATGTPCYNTWKTCKYIAAYSPGTKVYRYVSAEYPQALPDARPYVDSVKYMPTEIKTNLTVNARVSFTMVDEPDADVDTDPYWAQRSSHPGTYWKRWLARNVNYKGRIARIYEGVYGKAESTYVQKWMGRLENIKVKGDRFTFEAVDLLKDLAKVEIPPKTNAKLALDLAANSGQSFVVTEDADKFPAAGYVRIQDEIVRYTSVNVTTKTFTIGGIANRGQFGTTAAAHPAKEKVQGVKYYDPKNPVEILLDMLLVDAGMKDSWVAAQSVLNVNNAFPSNNTYIELPEATTGSWTAPFLLRLRQNTTEAVEFVRITVKGAYISSPIPARRWGFETYVGTMTGRGLCGTTPISGTIGEITAERGSFEQVDTDAFYFYRGWPLRDINFTSVISEPSKLSDLYMEIVDLLDAKSWVAENLKITLRKNTTNTPTTGYVSLSDADNIVFDSGSVDVNEKSRISRMTIYWDKIVTGKFSDEMSYRRLDIAIDPDAETNYGDPEEKVVKCRWIDPYVTLEETVQQFVKNLAVRRIQRCKHAQNLITVKVAEKDAGVKTGDYIRLSTDELLEADGLPVTARMYQVVKRDRGQREVTLTLIQVTPRRMAVIGPAGLPTYPSATEVQRAYGFIADATGRMSDGTEGYFIW